MSRAHTVRRSWKAIDADSFGTGSDYSAFAGQAYRGSFIDMKVELIAHQVIALASWASA